MGFYLFEPNKIDEAKWEQVFEFLENFDHEIFPGGDPIDRDFIRKHYQVPFPYLDIYEYLFEEGGQVIGMGHLNRSKIGSSSYESNKHILNFRSNTLAEFQDHQMIKDFFDFAIEEARKMEGVSLINIWAFDNQMKQLCQEKGASCAQVWKMDCLDFRDVDWDLMDDWKREGARKNSDLRLIIADNISERFLDSYCELTNHGLQQMPHDDNESEYKFSRDEFEKSTKRMHKQGRVLYSSFVVDKNNTVLGFTDLRYNPKRADRCEQMMTVVMDKYRGRGIGRWIKA